MIPSHKPEGATPPSSVNLQQLTETALSHFLITKVMEFLGNPLAMNRYSLATLGGLVFVHEYRDTLKGLPQICLNYTHAVYRWACPPRRIMSALPPPGPPIYEKSVVFRPDQVFLESLYFYLEMDKKAKFTHDITEVACLNAREKTFLETCRDISFTLENYQYRFNFQVEYTLLSPGPQILKAVMTDRSAKCYVDLLTPLQRKAVLKLARDFERAYDHSYILTLTKIYEKAPLGNFHFYHLAKMVAEKHYFDLDQTILQLYYVRLLCPDDCMVDLLKKIKRAGGRLFFDRESNYAQEISQYHYDEINLNYLQHVVKNRLVDIAQIKKKYNAFPYHFSDINTQLSSPPPPEAPLVITSPAVFEKRAALEVLFQAVQAAGTLRRETKVAVYAIKITKKIEAINRPNPAFLEWQAGDKSKLAPPDQLTDTKIEKVVEKTKLNDLEKSLSTLYLKEKDSASLMAALTQFRDGKAFLKKQGLKNKLNLLLYGEPGTGKSTTIEAVATFLGRDLYFVDLKGVESDEDLQLLFDYINLGVSNSGIVVIEDIDASTDLVLDRKYRTVSKEDKLTLAYFLNILQGTSTRDDSVFLVTTNHYEKMDPAFVRDGRFDVKLHLGPCDVFQMTAIWLAFKERPLDDALAARLKPDVFTPATFIYHLKEHYYSDAPDEVLLAKFLTE